MTLKELEARIQTLENIEAIQKLQRAYGYYLEHWEGQQLLNLFSHSPQACVDTTRYGVYVGQEGIKKFFLRGRKPPKFLHALMQLSGIVDVNPDGRTAKGRWYGFGCVAIPTEGVVRAKWLFGYMKMSM